MKLVIDTNILVSFFRQNPVNKIISNSKNLNLELLTPEYALDELKNKEKDLLKYSGLDSKNLELKFFELNSLVKVIPNESFKNFELKAKQLSPHDKDIPIFALALNLKCSIWSNEPAFKEQSQIKIFNTKEMIELFL